MARLWLSAMLLNLMVISWSRGADSNDARVLIEKSLKAMGVEGRARSPLAIHLKVKGVLFAEMSIKQNPDPPIVITGQVYKQLPDRQRTELASESGAQRFRIIQTFNGAKSWERHDDEDDPVDAKKLAELKVEMHAEVVASLLPLLADKSYTLEILDAGTVQGKAALVVSVVRNGYPNIKLFFDKATNLLAKVEYRYKEATSPKAVLREEYLMNYADIGTPTEDLEILAKARVAASGKQLSDFLRARVIGDDKIRRAEELIRKLGDNDFETRQKAKDSLIQLGESAIPILNRVLKDKDPEIRDSAKECLKTIGKPQEAELLGAVIRSIGRARPEGGVRVLLDYLPASADEAVRQEVLGALKSLAVIEGKTDPVLSEALAGKDEVRRAAAREALNLNTVTVPEAPGRRLFFSGLKQPMKGASYRDGVKVMEWEFTEVKVYNKLDDAIFAKP